MIASSNSQPLPVLQHEIEDDQSRHRLRIHLVDESAGLAHTPQPHKPRRSLFHPAKTALHHFEIGVEILDDQYVVLHSAPRVKLNVVPSFSIDSIQIFSTMPLDDGFHNREPGTRPAAVSALGMESAEDHEHRIEVFFPDANPIVPNKINSPAFPGRAADLDALFIFVVITNGVGDQVGKISRTSTGSQFAKGSFPTLKTFTFSL